MISSMPTPTQINIGSTRSSSSFAGGFILRVGGCGFGEWKAQNGILHFCAFGPVQNTAISLGKANMNASACECIGGMLKSPETQGKRVFSVGSWD